VKVDLRITAKRPDDGLSYGFDYCSREERGKICRNADTNWEKGLDYTQNITDWSNSKFLQDAPSSHHKLRLHSPHRQQCVH
jgi:hypothetical protein